MQWFGNQYKKKMLKSNVLLQKLGMFTYFSIFFMFMCSCGKLSFQTQAVLKFSLDCPLTKPGLALFLLTKLDRTNSWTPTETFYNRAPLFGNITHPFRAAVGIETIARKFHVPSN